MKKVFSILIALVLVLILTTSCKRSCVCYDTEGNLADPGEALTTKSDCEGFLNRCRCGITCKWE